MSPDEFRKLGSISLLDLDLISRFYGRGFLPFPFMFTQPSRFSLHSEYVEYARPVPDRFHHGDLAIFQECAGAYANADIRVECHVQYKSADTPSVRLLAYRLDHLGFLAKQRRDEDVIDVYELSPYLLGPAVSDSAALEKPGRRSAIVLPDDNRVSNDVDPSEDVTIHDTPIISGLNAAEVPRAAVTAFGTVQSHWRPTRRWGVDPGSKQAIWLRIEDDGDYLYQPDFKEAQPVTPQVLAHRIDQLISENVKALRQFRNG